jgi:hypothetical protein
MASPLVSPTKPDSSKTQLGSQADALQLARGALGYFVQDQDFLGHLEFGGASTHNNKQR